VFCFLLWLLYSWAYIFVGRCTVSTVPIPWLLCPPTYHVLQFPSTCCAGQCLTFYRGVGTCLPLYCVMPLRHCCLGILVLLSCPSWSRLWFTVSTFLLWCTVWTLIRSCPSSCSCTFIVFTSQLWCRYFALSNFPFYCTISPSYNGVHLTVVLFVVSIFLYGGTVFIFLP
jgi:hypothetical protein